MHTLIHSARWLHWLLAMFFSCVMATVAGCGGGGNGTGTTVAVATPTAISAQPTSTSAVDGTSAVFSVTVSGDGLAYQWQVSQDQGSTWTDIPGAVGATYTVPVATSDLNGYMFRVKVGTGGGLTSSAATLTVTTATTPVAITVQPAAQTATVGTTASFSVTATGTSPVYVWEVSVDGTTWTAIEGATAATLTLPNVVDTDNGNLIRVTVSNSGSSVTSEPVALTVTAAKATPTIATQPVGSVSVIVGQAATFTVAATGNPVPNYQWQSSSDGGTTYADISGATAASYTTVATSAADNGKRFRVNVSNSQGNVTSGISVLSVGIGAAPTISTAPIDQNADYPDNDFDTDFGGSRTATFSATSTGLPTPTYQWQISTDGGNTFTNITGATSASYTTPAVTAADDGKKFRLIASNAVGVAASSQATLHVSDVGFGGAVTALVVRPNGDILAALNGSVGCSSDCTAVMGIRVLTAAHSIVTLAGQDYTGGDTDGTGRAASFYSPAGITLDIAGNAYVTDAGNRIRKITPGGVVTSLAGGDAVGGFVDGTGALASFRAPQGITVDGSGNLYVADRGNRAIRKVTADGQVSTLAHDATQLLVVDTVAFDASNGLLAVGTLDCKLFTVSLTGVMTQIGGFTGCPNVGPPVDGPLATATFSRISGLAIDSSGNIIVNDAYGIRQISPAGAVSTLSVATYTLGTGYLGLATDSAGNVYTADYKNRINEITPAGTVTVFP